MLFLSFFAILLVKKGRKIRSDAVKNASRCSICYVPTQQKIRPDVVQDTSGRNFRSVLVATKKRFLLTSSEPLAGSSEPHLNPQEVPQKLFDTLGTRYPKFGQRVPVTCPLDARHLVPECSLDGHE